MLNGNILRRTAMPTVLAAAALGAAGCGSSDGLRYGPKAEAQIQRAIQPEMQRVAAAVIQLQRQHPDAFWNHASKNGTTVFEADGPTNDTVSVIVGNFQGTDKPNPKKVLFVGIQDNIKIGDSKDTEIYTELQLTAPGSYKFKTIDFPDHHDGKNHNGYSAYRQKLVSDGGVVSLLESGDIDTNSGTIDTYPYSVTMTPLEIAKDITKNVHQDFNAWAKAVDAG